MLLAAYLQLRHAANELVGKCHRGPAGVVEWDELRGQISVSVEQPEREKGWLREQAVRPLRTTVCLTCSSHSASFARMEPVPK